MAKMGRPDVYATHVQPYLDQIPAWYKTMTVRQIAAKLGISKTTLYKYANEYEELAAALKGGKDGLVDELKNVLRKRAFGFSYDEVTVRETDSDKNGYERVTTTVTRYVPPDLGSIHLLLKNLDPDWHNDDAATLDLKRRELEIKEKRAAEENW